MGTFKRTKEQLILLLLFVTHTLFLLLKRPYFQMVQMKGNTYREKTMKCNFYFIRNIYALKK